MTALLSFGLNYFIFVYMRILFPIFLLVAILAKDAFMLYSFHAGDHFMIEANIETSNEEGENEPLEIDDKFYDHHFSTFMKNTGLEHQLSNFSTAADVYSVPELEIFSPPPEFI